MRGAWMAALMLGLAGCGASKAAPSDNRNQAASLQATPQVDTRGWKVITSVVGRRDGTIQMLYGNDPAVSAARAGRDSYPPGAVLSLVTWKGEENPHWFGSNIPGDVRSVEQVTFPAAGGGEPSYAKYEGSAWKKIAVDQAVADERVNYIVHQRAAVMP